MPKLTQFWPKFTIYWISVSWRFLEGKIETLGGFMKPDKKEKLKPLGHPAWFKGTEVGAERFNRRGVSTDAAHAVRRVKGFAYSPLPQA